MPFCFATECSHRSIRDTCKFYRFPVDSNERDRWQDACRRGDKKVGFEDRLCSCHFVDQDRKNGPTLFSWNEHTISASDCENNNAMEKRSMSSSRKPDPYDRVLFSEDFGSKSDSLLSMERLDRSSPELWPEKIPGMQDYPLRNNAIASKAPQWMSDFNNEDMDLLVAMSKMNATNLVIQVKKLFDAAYQLGGEESKEMTRGKYLNVLIKRE